jgi:dipeptidyl aminopeptidase/acylaminoacyl peptidase
LTKYYGKKNNVEFGLCNADRGQRLPATNGWLLAAFNRKTKENGFYKLTRGRGGKLEKFTMGPYLYCIPRSALEDQSIKAGEADIYLVRKRCAEQSPNYFTTRDFKTFHPVSDVYPERNWNWLTDQLVEWDGPNDVHYQGLLYEPENMDTNKKYPVIIYYYETLSDKFHEFLPALPCPGTINIPWFVSRGYLVFVPDIFYRLKEPGKSALNAILSAYNLLTGLGFVDRSRIGIQGHSWGGFETNYVVTHSHVFAAACSASGVTDFISSYGGLTGLDATSREPIYELGQSRMGATIWNIPDAYLENSAIIHADSVTTPLLMMHNTGDYGVPFAQAVEFYTGLRRLGKKVWLLQYDGERHGLRHFNSQLDFTLRITQFFDFYLKNAKPPIWMTQGVPGKYKGIKNGLELDYSGKEP